MILEGKKKKKEKEREREREREKVSKIQSEKESRTALPKTDSKTDKKKTAIFNNNRFL